MSLSKHIIDRLKSVFTLTSGSLPAIRTVVDGLTVTAPGLQVELDHTDGDSVQIGDGTQTVGTDGTGASLNAHITNELTSAIRGKTLFFTGSGGALNDDVIPMTDVSEYEHVSVQLLGTFVASISVQGSNDGSTWVPAVAQRISTISESPNTVLISAGIFHIPVMFRYVRLRISAYASGTVNAQVFVSSLAPRDIGRREVTIGGTHTNTTMFNVSVPTANVEVSQALPANCKGFVIKARGTSRVQLSYVSGESGTKFLTIPPGSSFKDDNFYIVKTLYFQASKNGETVELLTYT